MIYAENILICIVVPLLVSLFFVRGSIRRFVIFLSLGMVMSLFSAYISAFFGSLQHATADDTSVFISPVVEEIMKMLPVAFFLLVFEPPDEDLTLSAVGIGIGFTTFENCCYILSDSAASLTYILIRGFAVGVMHIVCTAVVGYGLVFLRKTKTMSISATVGLLALVTTFHALYNLLVSEPGVLRYVAFTVPLIVAVIMAVSLRKQNNAECQYND